MITVIIGLAVFVPLLFLYLGVARPWQLHWGASSDEMHTIFPGDELVAAPTFNATRAVTVYAAPEHIFPWIVQMGMNRAGWYSYDWLDNLGRKSAETILPEYQEVQVGDLVPMSPVGKFGMWVERLQTNEWIVWRDNRGDASWTWIIIEEDAGVCRLITRVRMRYRWLTPLFPMNLLIEFTDFPMMRKCMLGIKRRAETMATRAKRNA